ncbi:MAG: fibronectin type III domain-containing protein [Acidimicrobiales bacterium]
MHRISSRARVALVAIGAMASTTLVLTARADASAVQAAQQAQVAQEKAGRLSPTLQELGTPAVEASSATAQASAVGLPSKGSGSLLRDADGSIHVDVRVATFGDAAASTLAGLGARVLSSDATTRTYTVAIDPVDLSTLSTAPGVEYAAEVLQPIVHTDTSARTAARAARHAAASAVTATCPTGTLDEGDAQLAANTARTTYGVDGTGVRVGILSDSYNNLSGAATDVAGGDLPGAGNPCGHTTPVTVQADLGSGGADEGRAMAQIVHDLAPGSPISFATAFVSESDFANQIRNLATNGSKVIVDDISYFDEPVYQDGIVAKAVNDVTAQGVTYFSSAANSNLIVGGSNVASYEAPTYRPTTCPSAVSSLGVADCHDFDTGAGTDAGDTITVPNNGYVKLKLGYNQPEYGITTDLDIALIDNTTGTMVASSAANNLTSKKAYEYFSYRNTSGAARSYDIVVARYGSGPAPRFKIIHIGSSLSAVQYNASTGGDVVGPTTYGHNNGTLTNSIAAVPYSNSNTIETYSSRGPSTYCWNAVNGTTAASALPSCTTKNVDVAATDGAATSFFGSSVSGVWRFYGTSAAAPHAAAVAALQLQARPCRTPAEVGAAQRASGRAIGSFGVDAAGSGLLHAGNAIANLAACGAAPGAPTGATATRGNGQATVTWTAPATDGGSPVTGYRVTPYVGTTAQTPTNFSSTATTQTITGLTNGTTYTFKVAATNAIGTGADSTATNAVTPATVPGAPSGVTATSGNGQATVTWTAPASDGGTSVTGYVVTPYVGATAQPSTTFDPSATTRTITGLANGTTYTFTVAAVNGVGTSGESAPTASVTPLGPASAPDAVTGLPLSASVKLSWSAPADANGSPITGYVVTPYAGLTPLATITYSSTATTQTITGLANGTAYTFSVAATTAYGQGLATLSNVVIAGTPSAPTVGTITAGNASAKIAWSAPANNGASITGYVVTPYLGSVAQPSTTFASTATTQTVTGLANGATYTFKVAATNSRGTGAQGTSTSHVVGVPSNPGWPSTLPGNGQAKVAWWGSAGNGAPVQGYIVTPYVGTTALAPVTFNSTATSQYVPGLTNGTTYTFKIAAFNAYGTSLAATSPAVTVGQPLAPAVVQPVPGNGTALVKWGAATANGAPVTGYVVTPYVGTTALAATTFASTATSQTITGLTNGTTYTFKVAATNAYGTGPAATTPSVVVGTPTAGAFPAATPGDGTALVSWWASAPNAAPVLGYTITPYIGSTAQPTITFNSTANKQTITGLANGTTYTFRISAFNSYGSGPPAITGAIVVGAPVAPTGVTAVAGAGQATVSWAAPASNGSPIAQYKVTPFKGSTAQATLTFDATTTSRVITGLTPGASYAFKVVAVNARGSSTLSSASAAVIPT